MTVPPTNTRRFLASEAEPFGVEDVAFAMSLETMGVLPYLDHVEILTSYRYKDGFVFVISHAPYHTLSVNLLRVDERVEWLARVHIGPRTHANREWTSKTIRSRMFRTCPLLEVYDVNVNSNNQCKGYGQIIVSAGIAYYLRHLGPIESVLFAVETLSPLRALRCYRNAMKSVGFQQHGHLLCTYTTFDPDITEFDVTTLNPDEYERRNEARTGSKWTGEIEFTPVYGKSCLMRRA